MRSAGCGILSRQDARAKALQILPRHEARMPLSKFSSAVRRTQRLHIVAFRDSNGGQASSSAPAFKSFSGSEHVSLPVDYYRLLQVDCDSRPDAIRVSYERLIRQPPATSYSNDTMFSRAVLLKAASECLADGELRESYDAKLAAGHKHLRVSQQDLPGALVVLQEVRATSSSNATHAFDKY